MKSRSIALLAAVVAGAVVAQAGCGGDDSTSAPPPSADGGIKDTGVPPVTDGNVPDTFVASDSGTDAPPVPVLAGASHGSSVAIAQDDSVAVVANRDSGSVTVLKLTSPDSGGVPTATVVGEVMVGNGPWQVAISPDASTAYVVVRQDQKVVKITGLQSTPAVGASANVGSEPTGIAMTPTGAQVWVSNWVDGTVSVVDTASMTVKNTVDLNAPLVATGFLTSGDTVDGGSDGGTFTLASRPALAHPRSLAITNNGDQSDTDEFVYVTEYFGQVSAPEEANGLNADTRKVGVVYKIKIADGTVSTITLAPLANMGFKDQAGNTAGCYPNQLQSITLNSHFAYVSSVCASPQGPTGPLVTTTACTTAADCATASATGGPLQDPVCAKTSATAAGAVCIDIASVKTTTAPVVSVIDTNTGAEVTAATASLNAQFLALYTTGGVADTGLRRYPLFTNDMVFVPNSNVGYVSANGADAVFRVVYDANSNITQVGSSVANFIDLNPAAIAAASAGLNPSGVAVGPNGGYLLVANDVSRNAIFVDLSTQAIAGGAAAPDEIALTAQPTTPADIAALKGKRFFNTGMGRWSLKGQGWGACQSCHGDGLTDNVTWYFARGPRQSTSLDGTFSKGANPTQRILNWSAINDELADFEGNVRAISGGVGAIVTTDTVPPATTDRIDVTTACATGVDPACVNGNGNIGLNGSAAEAASPSNPLNLNPAPSANDNEWAAVTAYVQNIRSPKAPTNLNPAAVQAGLLLFGNNGGAGGQCMGCHGGAQWTISKVFYTPAAIDTVTTFQVNQSLFTTSWPALNGLPASILPANAAAGAAAQVMRFAGPSASSFDQILCTLRNVGTFNVAEPGEGIAELRIDMKTAAQGAGTGTGGAGGLAGIGYNVPSLLGLSVGAPYFHAGNARTLEAAFLTTDANGNQIFAPHHRALSANFLLSSTAATDAANLVQFLLSIDGSTSVQSVPPLGSGGGDFCTTPQ